MATPPRLLDQVRERLRLKHYSIRTEQAYVDWINDSSCSSQTPSDGDERT